MQTIDTPYEVEHFQSGDWKDFKFHVPEFKSTADVVSRYGEDKTLGLLNQQVSARIRSTVKNSLKPNGKTTDELRAELTEKHPDLVIFTKADADKWTPENSSRKPRHTLLLANSTRAQLSSSAWRNSWPPSRPK